MGGVWGFAALEGFGGLGSFFLGVSGFEALGLGFCVWGFGVLWYWSLGLLGPRSFGAEVCFGLRVSDFRVQVDRNGVYTLVQEVVKLLHASDAFGFFRVFQRCSRAFIRYSFGFLHIP